MSHGKVGIPGRKGIDKIRNLSKSAIGYEKGEALDVKFETAHEFDGYDFAE